MMLSTHERSSLLCKILIKENILTYPLLPYLQKYISEANKSGIFGTVNKFLLSKEKNIGKLIKILNVGKNLILLDDLKIFADLIKIELINLRDTNIHCIFLHDGLTDVCLALDLKDIYFFIDTIRKEFKCSRFCN